MFGNIFKRDTPLEVGDYFKSKQCHVSKDERKDPGYYKVIAKISNLYFLYCNLELDTGCLSPYNTCPFEEEYPEAKKLCDSKECHHTCMLIPPGKLKKLDRIYKLKGKLDLGE